MHTDTSCSQPRLNKHTTITSFFPVLCVCVCVGGGKGIVLLCLLFILLLCTIPLWVCSHVKDFWEHAFLFTFIFDACSVTPLTWSTSAALPVSCDPCSVATDGGHAPTMSLYILGNISNYKSSQTIIKSQTAIYLCGQNVLPYYHNKEMYVLFIFQCQYRQYCNLIGGMSFSLDTKNG